MIRLFFLYIFVLIAEIVFAQDTLFIDINNAIDLAIKNNIKLKNSGLLIDQYAIDSKNFQIQPTSFNYQYGQLYSAENGWKLAITQNFGSIPNVVRTAKSKEIDIAIAEKQIELDKIYLGVQIKSVFLHWIYLYKKLENIETQKEYVLKKLQTSNIKEELGEIELIDKLLVESEVSELETRYIELLYSIDITHNNLKQLLSVSEELVPVNTKLELYRVNKKSDTSRYNSGYFNEILEEKYKLSLAQIDISKAKYFPSIEAGFFIQDVAPFSNMSGFHAGIRIPIWMNSVKNEIKKSKISSEIALNNLSKSVKQSEVDIENLTLELDRIFIRIRHFQNHALPAANLLLSGSIAKYRLEEIDFDEYIEKVTRGLEIKSEYLDCINKYNQTALKLEFYTK